MGHSLARRTTLRFLGNFLFSYTATSSLPGSITSSHSCQHTSLVRGPESGRLLSAQSSCLQGGTVQWFFFLFL